MWSSTSGRRSLRICSWSTATVVGRLTGLRKRLGRWGGFTGIYTRLIDQGALPENQPQGRRLPDPEAVEALPFSSSASSPNGLRWPRAGYSTRRKRWPRTDRSPTRHNGFSEPDFSTPPTLVTNDPALALDFARQYGRVIYKSTSSVRSIVRELDPSQNAAWLGFAVCPLNFKLGSLEPTSESMSSAKRSSPLKYVQGRGLPLRAARRPRGRNAPGSAAHRDSNALRAAFKDAAPALLRYRPYADVERRTLLLRGEPFSGLQLF